jgi:hypothetical protein
LGVAGFGWAVVIFWVVAKTLIFLVVCGWSDFSFFRLPGLHGKQHGELLGAKQNPSLWG